MNNPKKTQTNTKQLFYLKMTFFNLKNKKWNLKFKKIKNKNNFF